MNNTDWKILIYLREERSINKVAKRLFMTQPSLTYRLSQMEKEIGCPLFIRTNKGVHFTDAGNRLFSFAEKELQKIHVIRQGAVKEGHVVRMKKAYPTYYGSYKDFPLLQKELDTIHNLYCIGRNGQHRYNNMDHSMATAMEAVKLIRENQTDKTSLWKVNTEKDYQEINAEEEKNREK